MATDTVKTIGTLCNGCRPRIARPEFGLPFCPCQQFYHLEAKKEYEIDEERENNPPPNMVMSGSVGSGHVRNSRVNSESRHVLGERTLRRGQSSVNR